MYETILVGSDGGDSSQDVLEHAVELAQAVGATLHVVTVIDKQSNPMKFGVAEVDELNRAKEKLIGDIKRANTTTDVNAEIRRGDVSEVLLAYATETGADLLIVGQSDTGQIEATIRGSTVEQLTAETHIPLTIVPAPTEKETKSSS